MGHLVPSDDQTRNMHSEPNTITSKQKVDVDNNSGEDSSSPASSELSEQLSHNSSDQEDSETATLTLFILTLSKTRVFAHGSWDVLNPCH